MKKQALKQFFFTLALSLGIFAYGHETVSTTLKVTIKGIEVADGYVHVLLFNKAAGYPVNHEAAYKHLKGKAAKGEVTISFKDIPDGTYSIVVFHDKNANEKFDKNWLGSPKEPYGFSNIPGEFCGIPSFQQTSFQVSPQASTAEVKLLKLK